MHDDEVKRSPLLSLNEMTSLEPVTSYGHHNSQSMEAANGAAFTDTCVTVWREGIILKSRLSDSPACAAARRRRAVFAALRHLSAMRRY